MNLEQAATYYTISCELIENLLMLQYRLVLFQKHLDCDLTAEHAAFQRLFDRLVQVRSRLSAELHLVDPWAEPDMSRENI